ncbi:MAG: MEDS domain-containing protein [Chloroflexota bacterium]|nr:MEDS domain-containing protein [Chloroflexota bacterium]
MSELERQIDDLKQGDHLYLIYDNSTTSLAAAATYVKSGLARGEQCAYIVADHTLDEAIQALALAGIDVAQERERGALRLLTAEEFVGRGPFQSIAVYNRIRQLVDDATDTNFLGLRLVVEMAWVIREGISYVQLIVLESLLDALIVSGAPLSAICLYNRHQFSREVLDRLLHTHPLVSLADQIVSNPHYAPPTRIQTELEPEQSLPQGQVPATSTEAEALQRLVFLTEASRLLASSLDYERTLDTVARLAVPILADLCLIDIVEEDGMIHRLAIAHADPAKEVLAQTLRQYPPTAQYEAGGRDVLQTGRPVILREVSEEMIDAIAHDPEHAAIIRRIGPRSVMIVPLSAHEQILGAIGFVASDSGRSYGPNDLAFAEHLAQHAALAIHNARRYRASKETIRAHHHQQVAVVELGQRGFLEGDLVSLMNEAVTLVARTLGVEYSKVLELLPEGNALRLRAGVGWKEGLVGRATVDAGIDSQAGYTLLSDKPVVVDDLRTETRFNGPPLLREHEVVSGISVVIPGRERPFGVLGAHTTRPRRFADDEIHFLQSVAHILAAVIRMERTQAELARARARLDEAQEAERLRLAQELHDSPIQHLIYIGQWLKKMQAQITAQFGPTDDQLGETIAAELEQIRDEVVEVNEQLRRVVRDLRPPGLEMFGLGPALWGYVAQLRREGGREMPEIEVDLDDMGTQLPYPVALCLFRVAQEALRNALKHARAQHVSLSLRSDPDEVALIVRDDGSGFRVPAHLAELAQQEHFGLVGIAERVTRLGGQYQIQSEPSQGTEIRVRVPLD